MDKNFHLLMEQNGYNIKKVIESVEEEIISKFFA